MLFLQELWKFLKVIMEIAEKHNLLVIEDVAQALRATFKGKKGGSFGLAGCFSFYPAEVLGTAGDGGLVSTNDEEFAEKIRTLRDNGQTSSGGQDGYGFCSQLDNLQAAILDVKLKHLPEWIERRRELASLYHEGLSDLQELKLPPSPHTNDRFFDVYQNYVIRAKERDKLVAHLRESGIEILVSWPKTMHHHEALGLKHFQLPKTEQISNGVLSLPMYPELTNEQIEFVIEVIRKFYKTKQGK
jgi:dTDP-4-amino-4,6-dideoxygalactose transaminase